MGSALELRVRVFALLLGGCWANAQPAWTPPSPEAPAVAQCPIKLAEDGHVFVWETDLGVLSTNPGAQQLAIYPLGDQALIALRDPDERRGPRGGDTLWRVSCDGRKLATLTLAGADFGHAALHPDHQRLFYSTAGGVMALELASRRTTRLTTPGSRGCGKLTASTIDIVRGATRDHVEYERGGPCGFEGEWIAVGMRRHLARGVEEKATPITSVVAVGGAVWVAAGECGEAAVYRSTDWRSWQRLAIPEPRGRITLVADREGVVLATGLCSGTSGMPARISRDGGATWRPVTSAVVEWVTGDNLATLRAGAADGQVMHWRGDKLVATSVAWKGTPPTPPTISIDGRTLRPTRFGLYQDEERVFPR